MLQNKTVVETEQDLWSSDLGSHERLETTAPQWRNRSARCTYKQYIPHSIVHGECTSVWKCGGCEFEPRLGKQRLLFTF